MTNPAALEWLRNAYKAVGAAFPAVDFKRDTEETRKAEDIFNFYFSNYFYPMMQPPSVTLDQVRESWRGFYKSHL